MVLRDYRVATRQRVDVGPSRDSMMASVKARPSMRACGGSSSSKREKCMHIQINTDHNLRGGESVEESVRGTVEDALQRFSGQISRVEVHLADENAGKHGGNDKRCMMEARLEGHAPVAV